MATNLEKVLTLGVCEACGGEARRPVLGLYCFELRTYTEASVPCEACGGLGAVEALAGFEPDEAPPSDDAPVHLDSDRFGFVSAAVSFTRRAA